LITIENEIEIGSSVKDVYSLISGKNRGSIGFLSEDWPGLKIEDIKGQDYKWKYTVLVLKFSGTGTFNPNPEDLTVISENQGSFKSTTTWQLEPSVKGTLLKFRIDYEDSLMIRAAILVNKRRAGKLLENIKKRLERG